MKSVDEIKKEIRRLIAVYKAAEEDNRAEEGFEDYESNTDSLVYWEKIGELESLLNWIEK